MASVYIVPRTTKTKGERFHVRFEENGQAHQLGVFPTRALAKTRQRRAYVEIAEGKIPSNLVLGPARSGSTVHSVAKVWAASKVNASQETQNSYAQGIRYIEKTFLGKMAPNRVTPEDITRWVQGMLDKGLSAGTINLRLVHLGGIFDYAETTPNPVRSSRVSKVRKEKKEYQLPRLVEIEAWREKLPEKYRVVFDFMNATGARISEACTVRNKDWRPDRGVTVRGKTGQRFVPLFEGLPVFPELTGAPDDQTFVGITRQNLTWNLQQAAERAGVPSYGAHSLRHRHASILMHDKKMSPADLAARLGHSVTILLDTYTHVLPVE